MRLGDMRSAALRRQIFPRVILPDVPTNATAAAMGQARRRAAAPSRRQTPQQQIDRKRIGPAIPRDRRRERETRGGVAALIGGRGCCFCFISGSRLRYQERFLLAVPGFGHYQRARSSSEKWAPSRNALIVP